jgi:hypothetical protein
MQSFTVECMHSPFDQSRLTWIIGVDIVDMLMDDAFGRQHIIRPEAPLQKHSTHAAARRFSKAVKKGVTRTRQVPNPLSTQVAELGSAKRNLERLYTMEEDAMASWTRPPHEIAALSCRRAGAERRYVNALIRYLRDSDQMSGAEAAALQRHFTRQRNGSMLPVSKVFLLNLYPQELAP